MLPFFKKTMKNGIGNWLYLANFFKYLKLMIYEELYLQ